MPFLSQTVGIHKMTVRRPDRLRFLIHKLHKFLHGTGSAVHGSGDSLCNQNGDIVARRD